MHANGKTYAFQKGGDDWFSNGKKMDSTSVQSFLDKLRDLAASKFIDTRIARYANDRYHRRLQQAS